LTQTTPPETPTTSEKPRIIVICTGSRYFSSYHIVRTVLDYLQDRIESVYVGDATGADSLVAHWARTRQKDLHVFKADWQNLGKRAGFVRNKVMVDAALEAVRAGANLRPLGLVFWNGTKSNGTQNTLNLLIKANVTYREYGLIQTTEVRNEK